MVKPMSWRPMPDCRTASCTTGMMNSTSLRSRSFSAVSCAKAMMPTSLPCDPLLRVVAVGLVGGVGLAVWLEPLQAAGVGAEVLVPDRPDPQTHAHLVDG